MTEKDPVVVVSGARTAIGAYGKAFRDVPTHQLGAAAIRAAVQKTHVQPGEVDEVILGCVAQVGEEAFNARLAAPAAGLPAGTTASNVNRLCGSGPAGRLERDRGDPDRSGRDLVVGGNENMTSQPFLHTAVR
jgi:acetyl-CoA C-acetyltransferase